MRINKLVDKLINKPIKDKAVFFNRWKPPYVVEPKYDGERVLLIKTDEQIYMANRHNFIYTPDEYPSLFKPFNHLPHRTILDGELISTRGNLYTFLRDRIRFRDHLKLIVFDILMMDGEDKRPLPLLERKDLIDHLLPTESIEYHLADSREQAEWLFSRYVEEGYEGVVVKSNTPYTARNSWLKIKETETIDVIVTAIAETPNYIKTGTPESFEIAVYNGDKLTPLGRVSSGRPEIKRTIKVGDVIEVEYQEVIRNGSSISLRHPRIIRIRYDKPQRDCTIEQLKP